MHYLFSNILKVKKQFNLKIEQIDKIKNQLLNFSELFEICNLYDSNNLKAPLGYGRFEVLAAFGCIHKIKGDFDEITSYIHNCRQWIFGYIGYESSKKFYTKEAMSDKEVYFYLPKITASLMHGESTLVFENNGISDVEFEQYIKDFEIAPNLLDIKKQTKFSFNHITSKADYLKNVENIKNNIIEGDYYELNYCQEFLHHGALKNPMTTYKAISQKSPTPFAAFIKNESYDILCTSLERFIFRNGEVLVTQPIKGTNKRIQGEENLRQLSALGTNEKEIAENVMIVDLVRNDMAKICETGTIKVEELCATYPFALVNQMISTVSGRMKKNINFSDILRALFPMGSMTGAPKLEVMKNILQFEDTERGIYSGCLGYIQPNGNFDFNVIIRTLIGDKKRKIVSFHTGGAITYDSNAESEYEECLLKARGLFEF